MMVWLVCPAPAANKMCGFFSAAVWLYMCTGVAVCEVSPIAMQNESPRARLLGKGHHPKLL